MGIEAVALLHVPWATLAEELEAEPGSAHGLRGKNGERLDLQPLSDATLLRGFAPFAAEPVELEARLRKLLGDDLRRFGGRRGIYVFPDVAKPTAPSHDALVAEVGEVGFWIGGDRATDEAADETPTLPAELQTQLASLMGDLSPDELRDVQQALARGDASALGVLGDRLRGSLGSSGSIPPALQQSLETALGQAQAHLGGPVGQRATGPEAPAAVPAGMLGGDLLALAHAAQEQLQALSEEERDQVAALARQFGLPIGDPSDLMAALGSLGAAGSPASTAERADVDEPSEQTAPDGEDDQER